jgi:hypothetical protein
MVTDCIGGAFKPASSGPKLLFSAYGADGYEIRRLDNWRAVAVPLRVGQDDTSLFARREAIATRPSQSGAGQAREDGGVSSPPGGAKAAPTEVKRFGIEYTKLFLYPRLMVYENKLRVGLFLDSGDYLGRQSVFAGGSINSEGDFDLNLSVETRQFKPTLGFEVYRSRKHYTEGTRLDNGNDADLTIRYDLWDSYFTCKMELQPTTEFYRKEAVLQYNHGEYGLNIEIWEFVKPPNAPIRREFRGEGGWNYYLANELSLLIHYENIEDEVEADINPRSGRSVDLEITQAYDKLHSGAFEPGLFRPIYNKNYFGRYLATYDEHIGLPFWRHALSLQLKGGAIDRKHIDDFFYLYLGGHDGLRGYSYFSMGGTKMALARLTYRFPVWRRVNKSVGILYLGSLYAGAFAEAGKAWNEAEFDFNGNKKDVGFEIRLKGFTFSSYPIAASFEGAYGLDDVVYRDPFNTFSVFYEGHRWRYYGTILFSF